MQSILVGFFVVVESVWLWVLVLRLGSRSQLRRCLFFVDVDWDLHVLVQKKQLLLQGRTIVPLPDLKSKGIFLLLGSSASKGSFNLSGWFSGVRGSCWGPVVRPARTAKLSSDLGRLPEAVLAAGGSLIRGTAANAPAVPSPSAPLDLALPTAIALFWLLLGGQQGQANQGQAKKLKKT